jgi:hypothetical protein
MRLQELSNRSINNLRDRIERNQAWRRSERDSQAVETVRQVEWDDHRAQVIARINQLGSVASTNCDRSCIGSITVTFHPLVISSQRRRYLIPSLILIIPLSPQPFQMPHWRRSAQSRQFETPIHPHIADERHTCWGGAEVPIRQALERGEYLTVVILAAGWARSYTANDHLCPINAFPRTRAAAGWQLPK